MAIPAACCEEFQAPLPPVESRPEIPRSLPAKAILPASPLKPATALTNSLLCHKMIAGHELASFLVSSAASGFYHRTEKGSPVSVRYTNSPWISLDRCDNGWYRNFEVAGDFCVVLTKAAETPEALRIFLCPKALIASTGNPRQFRIIPSGKKEQVDGTRYCEVVQRREGLWVH